MRVVYKSEEFDIQKGTSIKEAFKQQIQESEFQVIGAKFNNEYKRLDYILNEEGTISLVDISSQGGMKIYRRTLIFIMAKAFAKIYPKIKIRVNYQLNNAMFCSLDNDEVTEEMLKKVDIVKIMSENGFKEVI